MRKTLWIIVLVTVLLLSACQSKPQPLSDDELIAEESAFYSLALGSNWPDSLSDVQRVFLDETLCCSRTSVDDNEILETMPELSKETLAAYKAANRQSRSFPSDLDLSVPYTVISQARIDEIFSGGLDAGWEIFYQLYPNAFGYGAISRVGFNATKDQALVWLEVHDRPDISSVGPMLFAKVGQEWVLIDTMDIP